MDTLQEINLIFVKSCLTNKFSLTFFLFLSDFPSAGSVITTVGTNVVLTCTYDAKYYGPLSVCWGRGAIPNSGCGNQVIKADGTSVVSRLSERYVLRGNLGQGDVSLTILQAVEADSGIYGCRVDIPGWFNDQKQEVTLTVKPGTAAAHDKKKKKENSSAPIILKT